MSDKRCGLGGLVRLVLWEALITKQGARTLSLRGGGGWGAGCQEPGSGLGVVGVRGVADGAGQ